MISVHGLRINSLKVPGIGRTYSSLSPTLRIDYIFTDDRFEVKQFSRIVKYFSDHFMIMADVELTKK